jgi:hypothetical protein
MNLPQMGKRPSRPRQRLEVRWPSTAHKNDEPIKLKGRWPTFVMTDSVCPTGALMKVRQFVATSFHPSAPQQQLRAGYKADLRSLFQK